MFKLGVICLSSPPPLLKSPFRSCPDFCASYRSPGSPSLRQDLFFFSLFVFFDRFLWNGVSSLVWILLRTHAGVCTVTVMVIRLLFHLESNIMMTLKLDMKHICKKEARRGLCGRVVGVCWGRKRGSSALTQRQRQGTQSFSEEGIQM